MTIEESVIAKIRKRRRMGRKKYGCSMERADLSRAEWLNHAQQEAMDFVIYLEKLLRDETPKPETQHEDQINQNRINVS